MSAPSFPGGTALSHLDIYDDAAPDGRCGGAPHVHLVSTEAYVITAGRGELQTLDAEGARSTPLTPGDVLWFTPGTVHRAVNHGGLEIMILMSAAGLPEAGDAVLTFPPEHLTDRSAYAAASALGEGPDRAERAARRRDLAVTGMQRLRTALEAGDRGPLEEFLSAAAALVRDRAEDWAGIVREHPLAHARQALAITEALGRGETAHLTQARMRRAAPPAAERAFGMCGRIRAYDLTDLSDPSEHPETPETPEDRP